MTDAAAIAPAGRPTRPPARPRAPRRARAHARVPARSPARPREGRPVPSSRGFVFRGPAAYLAKDTRPLRSSPMIRAFVFAALLALTASPSLAVPAPAPAPKMPIATFAELRTPLPYPYDEKADADKAVATAKARAKAQHKLLLIDLGGNWCGDCRILAGTVEIPALKQFVDAHYVTVTVDVGRFNRNLQVPASYGIKDRLEGVPALLIVDPRTNRLLNAGHEAALADARNMSPQALADWLAQWTR